MAVRIVQYYPSSSGLRPVARVLVILIGLILFVAGILAIALDAVVLGSAFYPGSSTEVDLEWAKFVVGCTVVAVLGTWLGLRALRGRRRLGLFLRRFGYSQATQTMSGVVAGRVGRSWRMVTLDDAEIAPQGTARRHRSFSRVVTLIGLAVAAYFLYWFFGGGLDRLDADLNSQIDSAGSFGETIAAIFGAAVVFVLIAALVLIIIAVALVVSLVGGLGSRAASAAQRRASVVIDRAEELRRSANRIARNNRRIFGSRLVVCRVTNPLWRDAVRGLAAVSDAVVVDVSQATDNVVWEVETMRATADRRWVLVCHRDGVAALVSDGAAGTPARARLAGLLDGHEVLVYGDTPAEQRQFARSLRNRLNTARR